MTKMKIVAWRIIFEREFLRGIGIRAKEFRSIVTRSRSLSYVYITSKSYPFGTRVHAITAENRLPISPTRYGRNVLDKVWAICGRVGARGMNLFPRSMFLNLCPFFHRFHAISPFRISYRIPTSDKNIGIFIFCVLWKVMKKLIR